MTTTIRNIILAGLALAAAGMASAADCAFIAHPDCPVATLSKDEVKNILLGAKTKWDSAGAIRLVLPADGAVHASVAQEYTARTADQFDKFWKKQVFTGKGVLPDSFKTDAEVIAFIAKTPGAFGYVAQGAAATGVKRIKVE